MISRKARLSDVWEIAPDVRHFVFEVPELEKFNFVPGQFVALTEQVNGKKIIRAYSISSAPQDNNRFELCLNEVPDGHLSPYLFKMKAGDEISFTGPTGGFVLRNPPSDTILIATGTGIVPFRSILLRALSEHPEIQFTLLFGTRYENTILYNGEFEEMARAYSNFHYVPTLSRAGEEWKGCRGYVQHHLKNIVGDRRDIDVFICGLKEMVDEVRAWLKEVGFEKKRIIYEKYD
jgi:CDP-4-dehydro-6-deoxyglucose reductase